MSYTAPSSLVRGQQIQAWGYYGAYGAAAAAAASAPKTSVYGAISADHEAVGEVRYIVGWASDQMSRMQWDVYVDGSADWELELPNGKTIVSGGKGEKKHPHSKASADVLKSIGWTTGTVRLVTTNLYVAGELFYAYLDKDWRVVSVIHPQQADIFKKAEHVVRGLWPSPIDPSQPDAPLFGVLSILSDMDWLGRLSRSQSANRVGMRGISEGGGRGGRRGAARWSRAWRPGTSASRRP